MISLNTALFAVLGEGAEGWPNGITRWLHSSKAAQVMIKTRETGREHTLKTLNDFEHGARHKFICQKNCSFSTDGLDEFGSSMKITLLSGKPVVYCRVWIHKEDEE